MIWKAWAFAFVIVLTSLYLVVHCEDVHCSRSLSRIVRSVLREHFFPGFEVHEVEVLKDCPLHESHDLYINQETNKIEEHNSRWICDICGKAFYAEQFIDMHFDNKHIDKLVKDSSVCLADYCNVFRCDMLADLRNERFWEKALCKKEKLAVLKRRCEVLMHGCLPSGNLSVEAEFKVYESIQSGICSQLTCEDYWKPPFEEIPAWRIVIYAIFSPFFIMALIIYYYSAWEYYFGDLFHDSSSEMEERSSRYVRSWQQGDVRRRHRYQGRLHMY